jgi:hypothetical protein
MEDSSGRMLGDYVVKEEVVEVTKVTTGEISTTTTTSRLDFWRQRRVLDGMIATAR